MFFYHTLLGWGHLERLHRYINYNQYMICLSFHDPRTCNMQHKMWTKPTPRRVKWIAILLHAYPWLEFGLPIIDHVCKYVVALERVINDHCEAPLWLITRTEETCIDVPCLRWVLNSICLEYLPTDFPFKGVASCSRKRSCVVIQYIWSPTVGQ